MSSQDEKASLDPHSFGVSVEDVDGVQILAVRGELDLNTAPQLEERLEAVLATDAALAIDLSSCEFIDSTGIGLIVGAWQRLDTGPDSEGESRFALCGPGNQVRRLLEITGLESSIRTYQSRGEALTALRGN